MKFIVITKKIIGTYKVLFFRGLNYEYIEAFIFCWDLELNI